MIIYKGIKGENPSGAKTVFRIENGNVTQLDPKRSLKVWNHSPDGFQWGYGGSGPSQLALALLLDVTGNPELSQQRHQDFKRAFVAQFGDEWNLTDTDILEWLKGSDEDRLQAV